MNETGQISGPIIRNVRVLYAASRRHRWSNQLAKEPGASRWRVYHIEKAGSGCWLVRRPGSFLDHGFDSAFSAETFVRRECAGAEAIVELNIDGVQLTAHIHPRRPTLFRHEP